LGEAGSRGDGVVVDWAAAGSGQNRTAASTRLIPAISWYVTTFLGNIASFPLFSSSPVISQEHL
jgi:hypothetical protein